MEKLALFSVAVWALSCATGKDQSQNARSPVEPALEQTYWKLVELEGKPALSGEGAREAHVQLSSGENRAAGSSGCNRVTGAYELSGSSLRFSKMAGTRMMCPEELMQQEAAFTSALEATVGWKIADGRLAFLNAAGAVLARFEPASKP